MKLSKRFSPHPEKFVWAAEDVRPVSIVAACYSKACAPPPVGVGGSKDGDIMGPQAFGFNGGSPPPGVSSGSFTPDEMKALVTYRQMGFRPINDSLRREIDIPPAFKDMVDLLDSAFLKAPVTTEEISVMRFVGDNFRYGGDSSLSGGFQDQAYVSTAYAMTDSLAAFEGRPLINIVIPKGTPVIKMSDESFEAEILLPRGGTFIEISPRVYEFQAAGS